MKNSKSGKKSKAIVIGAGLGGLAIACRLAAKGHQVRVFESSGQYGGKAGQLQQSGFTFDRGPSLFTMPQYVDEVFLDAGKDPRDYYSYHRLDTLCHYFFSDGKFLRASADKKRFAEEVERVFEVKANRVNQFLDESAKIHELTEEVFIRKSLHKLKSYLSLKVLKGLLSFRRIRAFETMDHRIKNYFSDPHLIQLFNRYATYNGSNPYKAPATLNVIPHLEFGIGAYMPEGGIHAIPEALYKLALELGVEFHFNKKVDEIEYQAGKCTGIRVGDSKIGAETIVSNADIYPTYKHLLPKFKAPHKTLKQERSSSALILYWGMQDEYPELDVHNIFFSANYPEEFRHLFEESFIYNDPTVYVHVSSKVCREHAPKEKENWFVMVNAPRHQGQNWGEEIGRVRTSILKKLEQALGRSVEDKIELEEVLTPEQIDLRTSSYQGSLYGTSSNNRFAAFMRHPNFQSHLKGLYFCGGSVHPGGGIPMVMSSARIVSDLID